METSTSDASLGSDRWDFDERQPRTRARGSTRGVVCAVGQERVPFGACQPTAGDGAGVAGERGGADVPADRTATGVGGDDVGPVRGEDWRGEGFGETGQGSADRLGASDVP